MTTSFGGEQSKLLHTCKSYYSWKLWHCNSREVVERHSSYCHTNVLLQQEKLSLVFRSFTKFWKSLVGHFACDIEVHPRGRWATGRVGRIRWSPIGNHMIVFSFAHSSSSCYRIFMMMTGKCHLTIACAYALDARPSFIIIMNVENKTWAKLTEMNKPLPCSGYAVPWLHFVRSGRKSPPLRTAKHSRKDTPMNRKGKIRKTIAIR